MLKKISLVLTSTVFLLTCFSTFVSAQGLSPDERQELNDANELLSNNLGLFNQEVGLNTELTSINGIISTLLPILLIFGGIILLFMLISGGFTMMTAVSDPKGADAGKQRITAALTGFFLLFLSYWIIQILEIVLGVTILG